MQVHKLSPSSTCTSPHHKLSQKRQLPANILKLRNSYENIHLLVTYLHPCLDPLFSVAIITARTRILPTQYSVEVNRCMTLTFQFNSSAPTHPTIQHHMRLINHYNYTQVRAGSKYSLSTNCKPKELPTKKTNTLQENTHHKTHKTTEIRVEASRNQLTIRTQTGPHQKNNMVSKRTISLSLS